MRKFYIYFGNAALLCICFLIFFAFNITLPFVSDDIAMQNSVFIHGLGADFSFTNMPYFTHNGRFGENLYFLLADIGSFKLDVLNSIVGAFYIFLFYYLVFLRLPGDKRDFFIFLFIYFFIIVFCPVSNFVWLSASFNYIWSVVVIMLFVLPFRIVVDKIRNKNIQESTSKLSNIFFTIFFIPISFCAGLSSELNIILIGFLLLFICYTYFNKYKLPFWLVSGLVTFVIAYICLHLSPGTLRRGNFVELRSIWDILSSGELFKYIYISLDNLNGKGYRFFVGLLIFLSALYLKPNLKKYQFFIVAIFSLICIFITDYYGVFGHILSLVILLALIVHSLIKQNNIYKMFCLLILFLAFLGVGVVTLQLGEIPKRAHLMPYLLLITILALLLKEIYLNLKYKKVLTISMLVLLTFSCIYIEAKYYLFHSDWDKVEIEIKENKDRGLDFVEIDKKIFIYGSYIGGWGNIENDENDWANIIYRKYYGLNRITLH